MPIPYITYNPWHSLISLSLSERIDNCTNALNTQTPADDGARDDGGDNAVHRPRARDRATAKAALHGSRRRRAAREDEPAAVAQVQSREGDAREGDRDGQAARGAHYQRLFTFFGLLVFCYHCHFSRS